MDRESITEACGALMRQKLSSYAYLFEGRLQGTISRIARGPEVSGLAKELVGNLERIYVYSKLRLSDSAEDKEKLREIERGIVEDSPPSIRDSVERIFRGEIDRIFTDTINVLDALDVISFTGFMKTLSLVEHMAYNEFLDALGYEIGRVANETLDRLYSQYRLDPGSPSLTAKAILQIVKPLVQENYGKKLLGESYKMDIGGTQVTVFPPPEEDRLLRLLSHAVDAALSVNLYDLKGMVYDSFASVGYRREDLEPKVVEVLAYIVKDLLVEIGRRREEVVAKSLERAGSRLIPRLAHSLIQRYAFYSLFTSKVLALVPISEEYPTVKRSMLRRAWGYDVRHNIESLADTSQDMQLVYLHAIGELTTELKKIYDDESIDAETKNKLKLLESEVLAPGRPGSLSHMLANCGYSVRLTRLESTRAWLVATVSSIPVLLELTRELSEVVKRKRMGGMLIDKVSEDYVKEVLVPGVISLVPIAAYYFDVMEAPILHRENKVCVIETLMREMVTSTSYREVAIIAEMVRYAITNLSEGEASKTRR